MKVSPYLHFNGNAAEAIAFYEKAFGVKAQIVRYKDAPPSEGYKLPPGTENNILYATITMGDAVITLCDVAPGNKSSLGDGISIMLTMDSIDQAESCFNALKEGGKVQMDLQETLFSKCFGFLQDKFGVAWMLSV